MKKFLTLALVAVFLPPAAISSQQQQQGGQPPTSAAARWETYTYPGEEFSVSLPEMPAFTRTVRAVKDRPNDRASERGYGAYADGVVYQVWSYEKPRDGEDLNYFVQYFKSYHLPGYEAREWHAVKLGGFDGRHYPFKSARYRGDEFSFYVYLARRHAYVVAAHGADERNASVRRFFQSFSLSDTPAGVPIVDDLPTGFEQFRGGARPNVPTGDATGGLAGGVGPGPAPGSAAGGPADVPPARPAPTPPVDYTRPFMTRDVTLRAALIFKPTPPYTEAARRKGITGPVALRMVLNLNGKVTDVTPVLRLPHGLTETAARAARGIKFIPAEKDGRRVSQWATVQFNFDIY